MARFTIYSPAGVALYEGAPTFTGQYMKPGLLEFREVALPSLVDLVPGCYVDYTRTGQRYRIYTAPQLKKQARANAYGGAYVYQSVQLYDASKMLEYCPFRDLVLGDNRVHFSTQPSISTFEGCDGLARRFEACLQDQYGANSWAVRIATQAENPDLYSLMTEPREFTVSGMNILECLDKVYEIWPDVGWIYKVENGVDTIVIGGGGINPNLGTYAYGKGNGLTSLTRTAANADEIANRIFAYGSSRNMLPRWYNGQDIKDAESVDIQNLMLPVDAIPSMDWSGWGLTSGERDAAKAFVEDSESIQKNGLRPATVYFDGKGEYPEIYPSIRETTIGMVRAAIGDSTAKYYPSTAIYEDPSARVDEILSAPSSFDSGLAGDATGKSTVGVEYTDLNVSSTSFFPAGISSMPVYNYQGAYTPPESGTFALSLGLNVSGSLSMTGLKSVHVEVVVRRPEYQGAIVLSGVRDLSPAPGESSVPLSNMNFTTARVALDSNIEYRVFITMTVEAEPSDSERTCAVEISGGISKSVANYRAKTFTVSLRQVGFDIDAQSMLGDGKTIAMRTGKCAGRSFSIKSVQYDSATDSWALECWRSEDESLSQWFPNTDYPVEAGDEFVLLDIAMPGIYVSMAEQKLLTAARDLLSDSAVERWQYVPEIDAKFMVEQGRSIRAGEYMSILDIDADDITPGVVSYFRTSGGGYLLTSNGERIIVSASSGSVVTVFVDTVVINEGEAAIPTYKVTLRDRKKKTWTESSAPSTASSKPVSTMQESTVQSTGESFFEAVPDGDGGVSVKLKSQYTGLWAEGFVSAGGVGDDSGGGGGEGSVTSVGLSVPTGFSVTGSPITTSGVLEIQFANGYSLPTTAKQGEWDGKSVVEVSNLLTNEDYVRVATITIDGVNYHIKAPTSGGGGGGTETDPIFTASAAYGISSTDIANWNSKTSNVGTITGITMNGASKGTSGVVDLGTVLTAHQTVTLAGGTNNGTLKLTTAAGTVDNIAVKGLGSLAFKSSLEASDIPSLSGAYVTMATAQTVTGRKTFTNTIDANGGIAINSGSVLEQNTESTLVNQGHGPSKTLNLYGTSINLSARTAGGTTQANILSVQSDRITVGSQLIPNYTTGLNLGGSSTNQRWSTIYGVNADLSGDVSLAPASHIDIGPLRIEYDATNKALHITKKDGNDTESYGIYADGFVASGGIEQAS